VTLPGLGAVFEVGLGLAECCSGHFLGWALGSGL
jgi:hypothetical protein